MYDCMLTLSNLFYTQHISFALPVGRVEKRALGILVLLYHEIAFIVGDKQHHRPMPDRRRIAANKPLASLVFCFSHSSGQGKTMRQSAYVDPICGGGSLSLLSRRSR